MNKMVRAAGAALGTTVTFVLAAVGGVVLHLDAPPARRAAQAEVNAALADSFQGKVEIQTIKRLGLGAIEGVRAVVYDPYGRRVALLDGVRARVGLPALLRSLVGGGDIVVSVTDGRIDLLDADLEEDPATGQLTIQEAFLPRHPSPKKSGGRGTELRFRGFQLADARIHGSLPQAPHLDVELTGIQADVLSSPAKTKVDVSPFEVVAHAPLDPRTPADAHAKIEAHFAEPSETGKGFDASGSVDLRVGDVLANARALVHGDHVELEANVPRTAPAALRALVPEAPILEPIEAHVRAHGELPTIVPDVRVSIGQGTIALRGTASIGDEEKTADLTLDVSDLDPRAFGVGAGAAAPAATQGVANVQPSTVSAWAHANLVMKQMGGLSGHFEARTTPTVISGQVVPAAAVEGDVADTGQRVRGKAKVYEEGAPAVVDFDLHPEAEGKVVDFDAAIEAPELARVRRIANVAARGAADVRAQGRVALDRKSVDTRVTVRMLRVARGGMSADVAGLAAHVHGPMDDPLVDASFLGNGVRLGGRTLSKVALTTTGSLKTPYVTASIDGQGIPHVDARARLDVRAGLSVHGAEVRMQREDVTMVARLQSMRVVGGTTVVDGVTIEGLGAPVTASARIAPGAIAVKAKTDGLDLARVARLAGKEKQVESGHLSLDVDVTKDAKGGHGHLNADLHEGVFSAMKATDAHVAIALDGRKVDGVVQGRFGDAGDVELRTEDLEVGGDLLDAKAWSKSTGGARARGDLDLRKLEALIPEGSRPLQEMAGVLSFVADVTRRRATGMPDVSLDARTHGLVITAKHPEPPEEQEHKNEQQEVGPPKFPFHIAGIDFKVAAKVNGESGKTALETLALDPHGQIAALRANAELPLDRLMASGVAAVRGALEDVPFDLHVETPARSLELLPEVIRPAAVKGLVAAQVDVKGTMRAPRVDVAFRGHDVSSTEPHSAVPLDLAMNATYDAKDGKVRLLVSDPRRARDRALLVDVNADVKAPLDRIRAANGGPVPWTADGDVKLYGFPLHAIPILADRMIEGRIVGEAKLRGLHENGDFTAHFDAPGLRLEGVPFSRAGVDVKLQGQDIKVTAALERPDGVLRTSVDAGLVWGNAVAPNVDKTRGVEVGLYAKDFRARALMPFLEDAVNELDGKLDADAKVHIKPGLSDGNMDGAVELSQGRIEIPAIGEELHDAHMRVDIKPWGQVNVRDISASGMTGHFTAKAVAKLDGFDFKSADGELHIAPGDRLPLTVQGVPLGDAYGDVDVHARRGPDGKRIDVVANIPTLHAELPQATGHSIQSLDDNPDIQVGTYNRHGQFVLLPIHAPEKPRSGDATPLHLVVNLGDDVEVKRDSDLRIQLRGKPVVDITDKTHTSGKIFLPQGLVEVFGKRFHIQRGIVTLMPDDPANPEIVVTAYYDAPDKTRVFADVTGRVKKLSVKLRSDPQRSQNEILSILLFGTVDGETGSPPPDRQPGTEEQAAGVAAGFVTQGINRMLEGIPQFDISTRLDTSDAQDPRPEVMMQVSQDVQLDVEYNLGLPPPGENPDRTEVHVDYRFEKNWTIETTLGDKGSSIVDLIWHRRY